MPAARFISWEGQVWTLRRLASAYHLPVSTLNHRITRFGESATGIARALATGLLDCRQAGQIGASRSPWNYVNQRGCHER
jgi:hypothetical protein